MTEKSKVAVVVTGYVELSITMLLAQRSEARELDNVLELSIAPFCSGSK